MPQVSIIAYVKDDAAVEAASVIAQQFDASAGYAMVVDFSQLYCLNLEDGQLPAFQETVAAHNAAHPGHKLITTLARTPVEAALDAGTFAL